MKIPLWCLVVLLACLFSPGGADCQGECMACGLLLQQRRQLQQSFNTMVCLLECEGHVSSSLAWELCKRAVKLSHRPGSPEGGALFKRTGGELELTPLDLNAASELSQSAAAGRFQQGDEDAPPFEPRSIQYDSSLPETSEEGEGLRGPDPGLVDEERKPRQEGSMASDEAGSSEAVALSKRFGGFQRGRHAYRKLISSPTRPLQKRYGGFIGVRKSARKWNSQKRMNQLLKQYLSMRSSRSGRFTSVPVTRVWRQDKL
ncbi:prepronociceptin b [Betta splendens]|uniref:Prepronociceptin b n=1 Tax=Betta splendens TaxID=158456 RepID=A0A6P7LTH4_BETSP|nr:prepronociceptin b [Betta splendens]